MRSAVGFAVGMVAVLSLACSSATNPIASSKVERDVTQAPGAIPYITGVHVAALPAFDDPALFVRAFNDLGEIVGDSFNLATSTNHTLFRWKSNFGFRYLQVPADSLGRPTNASAASVNDRGQVAFSLQTLTGVQDQRLQAAIWDWQGNVTVLRSLGTGFNCQTKSMNNLGVVLGECSDTLSGSSTYPTVWTAYGTPTALYPGGGGSPMLGSAYSISDAGYVSGQTGASTGFVFTPTKQENLLLPARASYPYELNTGVNDSGWVAGMVFDTIALHFEAAVWTRSDSIHVLYPTDGLMAAISDDGIAVGQTVDSTTGLGVPIIWSAANGLQRLPGLEHSNLLAKEGGQAIAINKVHQILGNIVLSTGQVRTVIWTLPDSPMLAAQLAARMPMLR